MSHADALLRQLKMAEREGLVDDGHTEDTAAQLVEDGEIDEDEARAITDALEGAMEDDDV